MLKLARIHVHPFKSLDPQSVPQALVLPTGALQNDRRFALFDRDGNWLNGKRSPAVHRLRTFFDADANRLTLRREDTGEARAFGVDEDRSALNAWLSQYFGVDVEVVENSEYGFPDDTDSPGPTVVSTGTIAEVASWFDGLELDEVRRRFRANLEIDSSEPFWEDRLVDDNPGVVRFRIGNVELLGTNPCQRCPVPTRDSMTGETTPRFGQIFSRRREETLPPWAPAARFDHFYRLSVNTSPVAGKAGVIRVGDEVEVLGSE